MGYRKERLTPMGPFPVGYRSTSFNSPTGGVIIPFTNTVNSRSVAITGGYAINAGPLKIYSVGETRSAAADANGLNTCDQKISNSYGADSRGYQVRDNAPGSYLCDDACYGLNQNTNLTIKGGDFWADSNQYSSAYETRVMGIVTL